MNPEFVRNLWVELTPPRLVLAVLLPGVLILAAWLRPNPDYSFINNGSLFLYYVVAVVWGTRRAANAIGSEVRGRTWEGQVMSALSAWSMTWGKLFGGCILVWMSALVCLASSFAVELQIFPTATALENAGLRICNGFAAQAVAMSSALIFLRKSASGQSLNSTLSQTVGILASILFGILFTPTTTQYDWLWTVAVAQLPSQAVVDWYGIDARAETFRLVSLAVFVGWTWLAANRLMRHVLQYSSLPWAWVAFVLFVVVYVGGFFASSEGGTSAWLAAAFLVTAFLVYPAALSDVKDAIAYGWLARDLAGGRMRSALQRMPAWLPTLVILFVFAVAVALTAPFSTWSALGEVGDIDQLLAMIASGNWLSTSLMLAILLFVIRDLGIIHMLAFSDASRYSDVVAFLVLIVLYLVIPVAGSAAGKMALVAAFMPLDLNDPLTTLGPVAVEAVLTTLGAVVMARRAARPPKPRAAAPQTAAA